MELSVNELERRRKISLSSKGRRLSEETKRKLSLAHTDKKLSPEHIAKLVKARTGTKHTLESIAKMGRKGKNNNFYGKKHTEETRIKMRLSKIGKPGHIPSIETRIKQREARLGIKSHLWKGGLTKIHKQIRNSLEYRLWREAVFKRDNWTCVWCKDRSKKGHRIILHPDHIKPFAYFPELRFSIDNGRTLCVDCHKSTDTYGAKARKYRQ